jgi:O-antigen/teichoic acid export membrane protein
MSILKQNIYFNVAGKSWSTIVGLVFIPVYLRLLGAEAFGLIAFFTTMLAAFQILEFGLGTTINRELARFSAGSISARDARDLVRTFEAIYFLVALCIGAAVVLAAPFLSAKWLRIQSMPLSEATTAVTQMGVAIALLWPCNFYNNGLIGLERQGVQNTVSAALSTVRAIGAVCALLFLGRNIHVFFLWQIVFGTIQLGVLAFCLWHFMPRHAERPRFRTAQLIRVWRFTVGLGATGVVSFILSQLDKLLLSTMLPLVLFAYYSLANQVSMASRMLPAALYSAFFPRFSALVAHGDERQLRRLYHQASQLVALIAFPGAMVGAFFAPQILRVWSGSPEIALHAGPIASVLLVGSAINSMMGILYDITIARGLPSLGFYQNLISVIILGPAMVYMAGTYGGMGAAIVWLILNLGYLTISAPIVHARVLPGELMKWYLVDICGALLPSAGIALVAKLLIPTDASKWLMVVSIISTWGAATILCAVVLPEMRRYIFRTMANFADAYGLKRAR